MKRIFLLSAFLVCSLVAFSQEQGKHPGKPNMGDRIKSEKIAYFTDVLNLSPEEAQVFWPIYNKFWEENMAAHDKTMKAFGKIAPKDGNSLTGKELEAATDEYVKLLTTEQNVLAKYYPEFKKVLGTEKVAKLFFAEESFRMKMIRGLREPRGPQPPQDQPDRR